MYGKAYSALGTTSSDHPGQGGGAESVSHGCCVPGYNGISVECSGVPILASSYGSMADK